MTPLQHAPTVEVPNTMSLLSVLATGGFIESLPLQQPSKIQGQPDYYVSFTTYHNDKFKQKNTAFIPCSHGSDGQGYLDVSMSAIMYKSTVPSQAFTIPAYPGTQPSSSHMLQPPPRSAPYSTNAMKASANGANTLTSTMHQKSNSPRPYNLFTSAPNEGYANHSLLHNKLLTTYLFQA
jgi:hypothetical protein